MMLRSTTLKAAMLTSCYSRSRDVTWHTAATIIAVKNVPQGRRNWPNLRMSLLHGCDDLLRAMSWKAIINMLPSSKMYVSS
jgi:hypothetical protein